MIVSFASMSFFCRSGSRQEAVLQVGKLGSPIRFSFDEFEPVDVSFHWPSTVGLCEPCENCRLVALDTAAKGAEFPDGGYTCFFEPDVQSFTGVVTNEIQEAVSQFSCLCESAIHLRDPIQLHLGLWAKLPWTGQHPPDNLPWGHVFKRRVRDWPRQSRLP